MRFKKTKATPATEPDVVVAAKAAARAAAKDGPTKLRHISTSDLPRRDFEERQPGPGPRGPSTGDSTLSPIRYLERFATEQELQIYRAATAARRAKEGALGWRELPGGLRIRADSVLLGCGKCGRWLWGRREDAGTACPGCNAMGYRDGARLRLATAAEEQAWLARETERWKKFLSERPERDRKLKEHNERLFAELTAGGPR